MIPFERRVGGWMAACVLGFALNACGDDDPPGPDAAAGADAAASVDAAPGLDAATADARTVDAAATNDTSAGDAASVGYLPCAVEAVLKARCQRCHGSPLQNGAPVPLLTYAHVQAPTSDNQTSVRQRMKEYVESDFMPLGGPPLSAEHKNALLGWLNAGAMPAAAQCTSFPDGGT